MTFPHRTYYYRKAFPFLMTTIYKSQLNLIGIYERKINYRPVEEFGD